MKNQKILINIILIIFATLIFFVNLSNIPDAVYSGNFVDSAYAVAKDTYEQRGGESYYHFDPAHIFDENGQSDQYGGITGGFVSIIDFVITKIGLPLGIIMSTWRVIYLAIFPLIIGVDPLRLTKDNGRYKGAQKGKADSYQEKSDAWSFGTNPLQGLQANRNAEIESGRHGSIGLGTTEGDVSHKTGNTSTSYGDFINNSRVQENVVNYIKQELKFMFLGLFITFTVWGLLKLCMMAAMAFLNVADSAATGMTS